MREWQGAAPVFAGNVRLARNEGGVVMFAKWVFRGAGIYGLVVIVPMYFLEAAMSAPPADPIMRPEFYYGFAGVALAFQLAFLVISTDPVRFRPLMPVCVVEKVSALAFIILFAMDRAGPQIALGGLIDQVLAVLFIAAYLLTPKG